MLRLSQIGHLGNDPELRYLPNGTAVVNISVANTRKWTNKEGVPGEQTTWIRWSAFGRQAEIVNEYLSKGRQVYVEGRLNPDENGGPRVFDRRSGEKGASYEAVASSVQFLGSGGGNGEGKPKANSQADPEETPEIPF